MVSGISHDVVGEAVAWRHHLHQYPEVAYKEHQTSEFVARQLARAGLSVRRGLADTGVVGTLTRGTSRRVLAIRADMDALPMQEESGVPHASRRAGVMHACGHDGHVAIALAAALVSASLPGLDGSVHFIFQPAEEGEGGAARMIREGLFRLFPCDSIYALHNWPSIPMGTCVVNDGPMMAALAVFELCISGCGCHSAMPHEGTDVILAACHVVSALQTIVSRNLEPMESAVVSVTQMRAGETWNVIPDTCIIRGSARWFTDAVGDVLESRISELTTCIAASFGCKAQVRYERRYPATVNDAIAARMMRGIATSEPVNLSVLDARPSMAAEDFAFMLQTVPGCYAWLGSGMSTSHALHSPQYDFNDELLPVGIALWVSLVQRILASN